MDCRMIRELILTDYLDGELDLGRRKVLESHLQGCRACAEFARKAQAGVVEPFKSAKQQPVAQEYLWHKIKMIIEKEPRHSFSFTGLIRAPKPLFAFSTCAALLIAVFVLTQTHIFYQKISYRQSAAASLEDQLNYFAPDETATEEGGEIK